MFLECIPLVSVVFQVMDTPYLVNPEWKNFIPGYLYNDSDLELTAESFYRQDKLILSVIRRLFSENAELWRMISLLTRRRRRRLTD